MRAAGKPTKALGLAAVAAVAAVAAGFGAGAPEQPAVEPGPVHTHDATPPVLAAIPVEAAERAPAPALAPANEPPPQGRNLTSEELQELAAQFDDQPLTGGQVQPRVAKWLSEDVFLFLQFDTASPSTATELRYLGLGLRSRFCAETQPDAAAGSWPHFHRWLSPIYGQGHGTIPAADGFWLTWMRVTAEEAGMQYGFFPTPPTGCVVLHELPPVNLAGEPPTGAELAALAALLGDAPFAGGQDAPYFMRWVNPEAFVFVEFDHEDPGQASSISYAGMGLRGTFCADAQPTPDFPHFRRWDAPTWDEGRGGAPGDWGYWMARLATGAGASSSVGIDRAFDPTPAPACGA